MNLNKISAAVKAALAKPGTFATDRGVEIEQRGGYKEILISYKGLKTLLEQEGETVATPPVVTPPVVVTLEPEVTTDPEVVVTEPAKTEVAVEDPVVEQKAPEPEVAATAPAPAAKAKPGPKPKAPAAA